MAYDRYGRYSRQPEDYDYDDRGFFDRAGDEVRSWFGDEEAERRREWDMQQDQRYGGPSDDYRRNYRQNYGGNRDRGYGAYGSSNRYASRNRSGYGYDGDFGYGSYGERQEYYGPRDTLRQQAGAPYGYGARGSRSSGRWDQSRETYNRSGDSDYQNWRRRQIEALDRDYDDYRSERQGQFENDFGNWRQKRFGQRQSLSRVREDMEVVGSDGEHVGKVDRVRGDRIKLAKDDENAGGRHHYVPCSWIQSVDETTVRLSCTAGQAQQEWRAAHEDGYSSGYVTSSSF
jgi:hypothetical protein